MAEVDFNADLSIVAGPSGCAFTPGECVSKARIKNPEIVVEVLSKSTRKFDMGDKLDYYKLIPLLQHSLLVDQTRLLASVYSRTSVPDEWLTHDYRTINSVVKLGNMKLPIKDMYRKIVFDT